MGNCLPSGADSTEAPLTPGEKWRAWAAADAT